jgi:hypothetical protein
VRYVAQRQRDLDSELAEVTTNWRLERIGAVERCVLRMAAAELSIGETPPRVVIQEAVTLAERFGSAQSARFVNGVLDALARRMGRNVVRLLVVNWQDRENPLAGGAEIHLHEIFGRLAAQGNQVTLLCGGWPAARRARRSTAWRSSASGRATRSPSRRARSSGASSRTAPSTCWSRT